MSIRIEAADNKKLKLIRKLSSRKHRDALGKYVIEGINLVEEAVLKDAKIDYIVASDDFASSRISSLSVLMGSMLWTGTYTRRFLMRRMALEFLQL